MSHQDVFATTHPSVIQRLLAGDPATRESGWFDFVRRYEEPIALCTQSILRSAPPWTPPAEDLAASFFAYLLLGNVLAKWDRDRGPLRAYVQGVLRRFLVATLREQRPFGVAVDPDHLMTSDDIVTADFERRWAYNVLVLALRHLGRSRAELADTWIALEGLSFLVADPDRWVMLSYDEALDAARTGKREAATADLIAARLGLAVGTIHNRKFRANTLLLGYVAAELRKNEPEAGFELALDRFFELLLPLVPGLAVLQRRSNVRRDGREDARQKGFIDAPLKPPDP